MDTLRIHHNDLYRVLDRHYRCLTTAGWNERRNARAELRGRPSNSLILGKSLKFWNQMVTGNIRTR